MDGDLAKLPDICDLADQYDAVGRDRRLPRAPATSGATGRGAAEELGVLDRIDVITGTLGKTLGGASRRVHGGARGGRGLAAEPVAAVPVLELGAAGAGGRRDEGAGTGRRRRRAARRGCKANTKRLRAGLEAAGFTVKPGPTPILPVMLGDAALATKMADELLKRGIYVIGFSYPVVPQGQARIRIQVSAAHTDRADRPGDRGVHGGGSKADSA